MLVKLWLCIRNLTVGLSLACVLEAGSFNVAGLEVKLAQDTLLDMLSLATCAQPPKGVLGKQAKHKSSSGVPSGAPLEAGMERKQKAGLQLLCTEAALGISSVSVVYQTSVTVPAEDRPGAGALVLACTQRLSVQDITAEVCPVDMRGSLQVDGFTLTHHEMPQGTTIPGLHNPSGHTVQVVYAAQCSLQAGRTADMRKAQRSASGRYVFAVQGVGVAQPAAASAPACASPAAFKAAVHLGDTHLVFHADAVLALCTVAGDMAYVLQQVQGPQVQANTGMNSGNMATASSQNLSDFSSQQPQIHAQSESRPDMTMKRAQPRSMPRLRLHLQLSKLQMDFIVADHITWGLALPSVNCHLDSSTIVTLLQQEQFKSQQTLQTEPTQAQLSTEVGSHPSDSQLAQPIQTHELSAQQPNQASSSSAEQPQQSHGLLSLRPNQANGMLGEAPTLQLKDAAVTLNGKLLLLCGILNATLDLFPASTAGRAGSGYKHVSSGAMVFSSGIIWLVVGLSVKSLCHTQICIYIRSS